MIFFEGFATSKRTETLEEITNEKSEFEYHYALQDDIDKILDLNVSEALCFQFNRDDKNSLGAIKRIS